MTHTKGILTAATALIAPMAAMVYDVVDDAKIHKDACLRKWRESMNYPRKKKKLARKRIMLEYQIHCWMIEHYGQYETMLKNFV